MSQAGKCTSCILQQLCLHCAPLCADFASLMAVGDKVYSISHFESTPAASYLTTLSQDPKTGDLTVDSTKCASPGTLCMPLFPGPSH